MLAAISVPLPSIFPSTPEPTMLFAVAPPPISPDNDPTQGTLRNEASAQDRVNLRREVEIQTRLVHPNIIRMLSWFQDRTWFYLALDYAAGGDVFKVSYSDYSYRMV